MTWKASETSRWKALSRGTSPAVRSRFGGEPIITGDVHAEAVHVCGRFKGALHAKKVVLTKAARMTGDIYYETLELQEGARFEGGFHCTGGAASKPVASAGMAPDEPQQPVHARTGSLF